MNNRFPKSSSGAGCSKRRTLPARDPVQVLIERIEEVMSDPDTIAARPRRLDFIVQTEPICKITRSPERIKRSPGRIEIECPGQIEKIECQSVRAPRAGAPVPTLA